MKWNVITHPKAVRELNELPADMRAKLTRLLEIVEEVGPFELREPHVKSLGNKLMEIRLTGRQCISRVIYAGKTGRTVILLHAFIKKTPKTPASALECAMKRLKEIENE